MSWAWSRKVPTSGQFKPLPGKAHVRSGRSPDAIYELAEAKRKAKAKGRRARRAARKAALKAGLPDR
jgi:hypothetical protein